MSIWLDYGKGGQPPPNTPELRIRHSGAGEYMVLVGPDQEAEFYGPTYLSCHTWCMNQFGLTSTVMLAVRTEYELFYPVDPEQDVKVEQNKYRKPST